MTVIINALHSLWRCVFFTLAVAVAKPFTNCMTMIVHM